MINAAGRVMCYALHQDQGPPAALASPPTLPAALPPFQAHAPSQDPLRELLQFGQRCGLRLAC
jgi:hypothetical protein